MNQSINFLFSWRKKAHVGSSETTIGHRVCCSLLLQAYNDENYKDNNVKKEKVTWMRQTFTKYVVFSIER